MRKKYSVFACCLLFVLFTPFIANAFIAETIAVVGLKRLVDKEIEKTSRSIAKGALGEFNRSMQILFEDQINPLLADIDFMVGNRVDQIDSAVEQRIDQTEMVILNSIREFEGATTKTINQIRDKVISKTAKEIKEIERQLFDDIFNVINEIKYMGKVIDCTEEKWKIDVKELIGGWFFWKFRNRECYKELNLKKRPEDFQYRQIYSIKKCTVLNTLDESVSIEQIQSAYADLSVFALRTACIQRAAGPEMNKFFLKEWISFGQKYKIWENTKSQ